MFHSEAHYENHDSKVTVNHLKCLPIISGRLSLCAAQIICGTRRRVEWMLTVGTLGGDEPVGWPRMKLEMHLHLNSELASNEFLIEFAFKIRKIPSGFA